MLELIILGIVVALIFWRLRSVLGQRPDDDGGLQPGTDPLNPPLSRQSDQQQAPRGGGSDTVVPMEADPSLRQVYRDIRKADPGFDADGFVGGAEGAYRLILEAFWAGEKNQMRPFVADDVFDQFAGAIDQRDAAGHQVENRIIAINMAQITNGMVKDSQIRLTVTFDTEIVSLVRDAEGRVIEGDPSDTVTVTDIWTFARDARSDDPNWLLVATRAG